MRTFLLLAGLSLLCAAQEVLNNDSIVKMTKAGLGETLIISMIQSQPGKYSLSPDELVKLKAEGVSEKVLAAMVGRSSATTAASVQNSAAPSTDTDLPPSMEIGVYYKKAGKWVEMMPEVVNWKTGGVIKTVASAGIVKGDINGHVPGPHSRNSAASPLEVVVFAPEGVAITEYQLLHLREQKESREFRTVTGGVMHLSGGATRDVIPFEGKRVGNRLYKVLLPSLGAGEYGFLPPGAVGSASSASIGKLYSFRIVE